MHGLLDTVKSDIIETRLTKFKPEELAKFLSISLLTKWPGFDESLKTRIEEEFRGKYEEMSTLDIA